MTANVQNLTSNQKEFMDAIRTGHAELVESGYNYPVLNCSIETMRTARSLEKRGLITIGTISHFEYNVQLVVEDKPKTNTKTKPRAKTQSEKDLLEQVVQFFETKKKQLKKITMVGPKTSFLDEVISELRAMQ